MTFPVLIFLVMTIFEVSRMMMVQQSLAHAAQEGSRTASLATTITQSRVEDKVRSSLLAAIPNNASAVNVQVTPTTMSGMSSGTPVEVDVQVNLADVSWLPGGMLHYFGNPKLSAQAKQDRE